MYCWERTLLDLINYIIIHCLKRTWHLIYFVKYIFTRDLTWFNQFYKMNCWKRIRLDFNYLIKYILKKTRLDFAYCIKYLKIKIGLDDTITRKATLGKNIQIPPPIHYIYLTVDTSQDITHGNASRYMQSDNTYFILKRFCSQIKFNWPLLVRYGHWALQTRAS